MYCETCRYWNPVDETKEIGTCHRNPPFALMGVDRNGNNVVHSGHVQTQKRAWCGEYAAKRSARKRRK